ncbi:MAG: 50S ribosomal protein L24 [Candidatus Babeliales bacterium]
MVARVKKNDTIVVLTGRDKGKQGEVVEISRKKNKVLVKGVALVTRHIKARRAGEAAGIKKEEGFVNLSNVMPVCTECKKPSRVNTKMTDEKKRVRICNRCKKIF